MHLKVFFLLFSGLVMASPIAKDLAVRQGPNRKWEMAFPDPHPLQPLLPFTDPAGLTVQAAMVLGVMIRSMIARITQTTTGFNSLLENPNAAGFTELDAALNLYVSIDNDPPEEANDNFAGVVQITNPQYAGDIQNEFQGRIAIGRALNGAARLPTLQGTSDHPLRAVIQYRIVNIPNIGPPPATDPNDQPAGDHRDLPGGSGDL